MRLTIEKAETKAYRGTFVRERDGQHLEESTRITSGTIETRYGIMEFDKYFVTNHTLKKRSDFVVIRAGGAPPLNETFARINRAASVGKRAVRQCRAVFGARLSPEAAFFGTNGAAMESSTDVQFDVGLPLAVSDLTEVAEFDITEDGEGLFWARISSRNFDVYADNPAMKTGNPTERSGHSTLVVFIGTGSPDAASANPNHVSWRYADALLTPTAAELPGALGDVSLRAALSTLRPGETTA